MIQPSTTDKQSIDTVIRDLEDHKRRITGAIEWAKNVASGIEKCRGFGQIEFSVLGMNENSTSVGIILSLPAGSQYQDVHVTTLVCQSAVDPKQFPQPTAEAMRLSQTLHWQEILGVKVLETWFVDSKTIWQGSESATELFLTNEVRRWMNYWFPSPPKAVFRSVKTMQIVNMSKKVLT